MHNCWGCFPLSIPINLSSPWHFDQSPWHFHPHYTSEEPLPDRRGSTCRGPGWIPPVTISRVPPGEPSGVLGTLYFPIKESASKPRRREPGSFAVTWSAREGVLRAAPGEGLGRNQGRGGGGGLGTQTGKRRDARPIRLSGAFELAKLGRRKPRRGAKAARKGRPLGPPT